MQSLDLRFILLLLCKFTCLLRPFGKKWSYKTGFTVPENRLESSQASSCWIPYQSIDRTCRVEHM